MLNIDSLKKGIVIDHIQAGLSMEIYRYLKLDKLDCSVAVIKNVKSKQLGKKDIIKIEDMIDIDMEVLGFLDHNITINIIDDGVIVQKKKLQLPTMVRNIIKCRNPRCITSVEPDIEQVFRLIDPCKKRYSCLYCESRLK